MNVCAISLENGSFFSKNFSLIIFKLTFCESFKNFISWDFQIMELGVLGLPDFDS